MLVYQYSVLGTTAKQALQCIFGYLPLVERPTLAYLERLWENFAGMTEAEKLEYSHQPSDARVTRKRKLYFQDLASPDTVVLDRVLQENRSRVMRSLRQRFVDEFCEEHELDTPSLSTVYRTISSTNS